MNYVKAFFVLELLLTPQYFTGAFHYNTLGFWVWEVLKAPAYMYIICVLIRHFEQPRKVKQ
jgi:hypothetical protein